MAYTMADWTNLCNDLSDQLCTGAVNIVKGCYGWFGVKNGQVFHKLLKEGYFEENRVDQTLQTLSNALKSYSGIDAVSYLNSMKNERARLGLDKKPKGPTVKPKTISGLPSLEDWREVFIAMGDEDNTILSVVRTATGCHGVESMEEMFEACRFTDPYVMPKNMESVKSMVTYRLYRPSTIRFMNLYKAWEDYTSKNPRPNSVAVAVDSLF